MNSLVKSRNPHRWLLAFTFTTFSACNALEYHLAVDQPIGTSWNNLASWKTNSDGTGSSPTSMSTHAFFTNNHSLRANQTTFGGTTLTLNGGSISLKTDLAGQTATINKLVSHGGSILQANAYTSNTLLVKDGTLNADTITNVQSSLGRAYTLIIEKLAGAGTMAVAGTGTILFHGSDSPAYTGKVVIGAEATMFHFKTAFQCRGELILEEQARIYLDAHIRVRRLMIKGIYLSPGTYTQAELSATYGTQMFPSGTGSIAVTSSFPGSVATDALCVNIFQNLVPEDRDFEKWKSAGIKYIRAHYTWSSIETPTGFKWTGSDALFARAQEYDINVIWLLAWGNSLHENDGKMGIHTDNGRKKFAAFAATLCARYRQPGTIWEIWNEQDTYAFWQVSSEANNVTTARERADQYMALVRETVPAMKLANPDCTVVSGGVVNIGWDVSKAWLERAISAGLHQYVDGIAVHLYGAFEASAYRNNDPERILNQVADLRKVLADRGAPASYPLLCTEYGATLNQVTGTDDEKNLRVAEINMRMFFLTQLAGLRINTWYVWKDYDGHSSAFCWLKYDEGLSKFIIRPSYYACRTLNDQLSGYVFEKRIVGYPTDRFILSFRNGSNRKLVVWTNGPEHTASIAINSPATTFATASLLGTPGTVTAAGGVLSVPLSGSLQYIDLGTASAKEGVWEEVENLIPASSSGRTQTSFIDSDYSNGALAYYPAAGENEFVTYNIEVPQAGSYQVKLRFKKHFSRGKFQLSIDDAPQSGVQDQYAASVASAEVSLGTKFFSSAGSKAFRFAVPIPGKHTNSTGYGLSFDYIQLQPQ